MLGTKCVQIFRRMATSFRNKHSIEFKDAGILLEAPNDYATTGPSLAEFYDPKTLITITNIARIAKLSPKMLRLKRKTRVMPGVKYERTKKQISKAVVKTFHCTLTVARPS